MLVGLISVRHWLSVTLVRVETESVLLEWSCSPAVRQQLVTCQARYGVLTPERTILQVSYNSNYTEIHEASCGNSYFHSSKSLFVPISVCQLNICHNNPNQRGFMNGMEIEMGGAILQPSLNSHWIGILGSWKTFWKMNSTDYYIYFNHLTWTRVWFTLMSIFFGCGF